MRQATAALPRSWPLVGILPALKRAPHTTLAALQAHHGDRVPFRVGPVRLNLLSDPEAVRALLCAPEEAVGKVLFYDKLKPALGNGLLTSGGEQWRRQRALVQPLLTPRAVQSYAPTVVRATRRLLQAWRDAAVAGREVDAGAWSGFLAREVTVAALFGDEGGGSAGEIAGAVATVEAWTARRFWAVVDPELIPSPGRRRYRRALAALDREIYGLIARRRADPDARDDLLARLVRAHDADGEASDRQLRDEVMTLYLAGQETTANALAWTLWLLACAPEVQDTLRAECRDVLGDNEPEAADVRSLPWVRATVEESLRLYPPVWSVNRTTRQDVDAAGTRLAAGTHCEICPWILHRRADVWDEPESFRPARFHTGLTPRAFVPFGHGPRNCVGRDLAMLELQMAVAMIVREFGLTDASPQPVRPRPYVTLTPEPAPRLRLTALN